MLEDVNGRLEYTHDYCSRCGKITFVFNRAGMLALWRDVYKDLPTTYSDLFKP
jgi:hypothetical protein